MRWGSLRLRALEGSQIKITDSSDATVKVFKLAANTRGSH